MSNRKGLLLAIGVIIMGLFITAGSYAFWSWASDTNKTVAYNTAKALRNYIIYEEGNSEFTGEFKAVNSYTQGMSSTITISKTSEAANIPMVAIIHMDINQIGNTMKTSPALKWVVTQGNTVLGQGNFAGANSGDTLDLVNNIEVTTTPTVYTIYIWLDKSLHPSNALSGETLDTNVWTEITQTAGMEDRFEITRINANYQNISATVVDSKHKVTHYAVVTSGSTPSNWTSIGTSTNIYNLNTTVSAAGTYDVYFKDEINKMTHKSVTVDAIDTTAPSCTFGSFTPVQVSNNDTATIDLTCTDNESDITVSNLTTSDITKSNNSINITNITKTSITHGYKYTITVTGTDNDGSTALTLDANKVRNAVSLGNAQVTSTSITVANQYTISFATGNNSCTLDTTTTYATKTPTYGDIVNIPAPSCTGYTFAGWTANSGLDTTNAKYGDTNNPTTAWSSTATPVTATYFKDIANKTTKTVTLTATWTANTYKVRFRGANSGDNAIPVEYQRVEYIRSSGTQYIDTGFTPNQDTSVELNFKALQQANQDYFGTSTSSNGYSYGFYDGGSNIYDNYNDDINVKNGHMTGAILVRKSKNVTTVSGAYNYNYTHNTTTFTSAHSLYLFARWKTSGAFRPATMEVYEFKIWDNDTLKRDFIPCYRTIDANNIEIGLCDIVYGVFYPNIGGGTFVKGNDVNTDDISKVQTFTYNVAQNLANNTFTKDGYTFTGWNTQANGSGTSYTNHQQVNNLTSVNNDIIDLYAQWQRNSYTVQVVVNNGTGSTTKNVLYNDTETFTIGNNTGYSNPTVSCTNGQTATISGTTLTTGAITNDTVCTITYVANNYTVRFYSSGYQEVEYIGSNGTQYIDTGYKHNQNTRILADIDFQPTAAWQSPFGSWGGPNASPKKMFGAEYASDSKTLNLYYGNSSKQSITTKSIYTGRKTWDFNKNVWKIGGTTKTFTAATFQSELNDYIFATSGYGTVAEKTTVKVYSFKIYESDELVRDFVPCYRISDGEMGLFDLVNYQFYPNNGTDLFNEGNDVYDGAIIKEQSFTYGVSQRLDENPYERNGYVFNGWNTSPDGTGTSYSDEQQVENLTTQENGVFNLYAKWLTNDYNIQFISSNELCTLIGSPYANATVGYNDDINVPNPTCAGFNFTGWTSYTISSSAKSGTTANPTTYWGGASTKNTYFKNLAGRPNATVTMIANWTKTDNTAPTLTVGTSDSGTTYTKSKTATITLSDNVMLAAGTYTIKYGWATSALTCADMTDTTTITVIAGETSKTTQVTIDTVTGAGRLYVCNPNDIDDRVGNTLAADTVSSTQMYLDNTPPTGTMTLANNGGVKTTLTVTDANAGMGSTYYYLIDTSPITCDASTTNYNEASTNTYTFTVYSTGLYYVCAKAVDTAGNAAYFTGSIVVKAYLKTLSGDNDAFKDATYKTNITNIYFVNNVSIPNDAVATYDLDDTNVGLIKGWIVDNPDTTGKYLLYIGSNEPIYGRNLSSLFKGMTGVKTISFDNFNTSEATTMKEMFSGATRGLTSLDLTNFDTSNVTDMQNMFSDSTVNCVLQSIKFGPNFDTSKVNTMYAMFRGCYKLVTLDLSGFNTSNVTNMFSMFRQCEALQVLNLSSFNTSKVTNMKEMFYYDFELLTIYASSSLWTNANVNDSNDIFSSDSKLIGGLGTAYSGSYKNKTRAVVDAVGTPGYLTEVPTTNMLKHGTSVANTGYFLSTSIVKNKIKKITFTNSISGHTPNGTDTWDVSFHENGSVLAWVGAADENGRYEMTIGQNGGVVVSNGYYLFSNLNNLTAFDGMQYLDTSNVTNMRYMFYGCSNLTALDLSNFSTSSATTMNYMFSGCSKLTTLNLSNFNTSNVKHMSNMFSSCSGLTSITFGNNFSTSNVTTMEGMFYGCSKLTSINLSNFNTSKVTNMSGMFYGCSGLTSLDITNFNTANVTTMVNMFRGCSKLTSLNLSNFNTAKVTTMDGMFQGASGLLSLDLRSFDTSNVTDMGGAYYGDNSGIGMFNGCTNLKILDISSFDTSKVTDTGAMFYKCTNLLVIYASSDKWSTAAVTRSTNMFTNDSLLVGGNGTLYSSSYTDMTRALVDVSGTAGYLTEKPSSNMLEHGTNGAATTKFLSTGITKQNIKKITFTNSISGHTPNGTDTWDVSYQKNGSVLAWVGSPDGNGRYEMTIGQSGGVVASNGYYLFSYLTNLVSFDGLEYFDTSNVINMRYMFDGCSSLASIDLSHMDASNVRTMTGMFRNCSSLTTIDMSVLDTSSALHMASLFNGDSSLTSITFGGDFDTSKVTTMNSMFYGCSGLTTLNLSSFVTSNVTNMGSIFYGCSGLSTLNISSFRTPKVTTMANMFYNCSHLTTLNLSDFDTSKVTNMTYMFYGTTALSNLNISSFDTTNVTDMSWMFSNNKGLVNLDLSHFDTQNVTTMREMFASTNLVTINLSGWTNEKLTNMQRMFMSSSRIQSIDFTNFQTPLVDGLSQTFDGCNALRGLDLSSFTTTNMTALSWTFRNCHALSYLNLSSFDTSNVTNTQEMFSGCSNLSTIYVTSNLWNMNKVTTHTNMFRGCSVILGGNGTAFNSSSITKTMAVIDTSGTAGYLTAIPSSNALEPGTNGANTTTFLSTDILKNQIKKITFTNSISGHTPNGTNTWDVSLQKNGSVLAWVGSPDGNGRYEMTIGQSGGVVAANGYSLFRYLNNLTTIDGMQYFDTTDVTLMRYMFDGLTSLASLDLSHFDTSNAVTMRAMFRDTSSLSTLNVSNFNTAKVKDMAALVENCAGLTTLDLSNFNTSSVTDMGWMFQNCSNLGTIYASNLWNTTNVTSSTNMFKGATNLPNFNSSVVDATNAHTGTGGYLTYKAYP